MKFAVLGNAVVDCVARVPDAVLEQFRLPKGDAVVLPRAQFLTLSAAVPGEAFQSGGASANMAWTLGKLGHSVAFLGQVGNDPAGQHFAADMLAAGVALPALPQPTLRTLEVFALITPDGTRTLVQPQPPEPSTDDTWVHEAALEGADWLCISAYTCHSHPAAVRFAVAQARRLGTPVALLLGSPHAVRDARALLLSLLEHGVQLVLGNEQEFALLGADSWPGTTSIITHSARGATAQLASGQVIECPVAPVAKPTDRTGAGDAFVAGFLASWNGQSSAHQLEDALRRGHMLARACVQHMGARLPDPKAAWHGTLAQAAA
jgi:sugar/nucleoside kinase (ribokinase family)